MSNEDARIRYDDLIYGDPHEHRLIEILEERIARLEKREHALLTALRKAVNHYGHLQSDTLAEMLLRALEA